MLPTMWIESACGWVAVPHHSRSSKHNRISSWNYMIMCWCAFSLHATRRQSHTNHNSQSNRINNRKLSKWGEHMLISLTFKHIVRLCFGYFTILRLNKVIIAESKHLIIKHMLRLYLRHAFWVVMWPHVKAGILILPLLMWGVTKNLGLG